MAAPRFADGMTPEQLLKLGEAYLKDNPRPRVHALMLACGLSRDQWYKLKDNALLSGVYQHLMTRVNDAYESMLLDKNGFQGARFFLETQAQWMVTSRQEQTGANGGPILHQYEDKDEGQLRLAVAEKIRELGFSSIAELGNVPAPDTGKP